MTKAKKLEPREKTARAKKPEPVKPVPEGVLSDLETVLEILEGYPFILSPKVGEGAELLRNVMDRLGSMNEFEFTVKREMVVPQCATIRVRGATRSLAQRALQNLIDKCHCNIKDAMGKLDSLEWKTDPGDFERYSEFRIKDPGQT